MKVKCSACGRRVPADQIADPNLVNTGGDTICIECHLDCCPEDAKLLGVMTAKDYVNSVNFPVLRFVSAGHPTGCKIALGIDGMAATDGDHFDLGNLSGTDDGRDWEWDGRSGNPRDWTLNDCSLLRIVADEETWKKQAVDYATCDGSRDVETRDYLVDLGLSEAEATIALARFADG